MKKIAIVLMSLMILMACKEKSKETAVIEEVVTEKIAPITDDVLESAVIYEANIRQYSPEGTFAEFTKDMPQLRELGVKVIWLMPIHPISEVKRKATGDKMTSDIEDPEERKKYLGSYYAVADYKAVNPDLGSKEDFRELVNTAHENGIYVILDWVPNHTGWDHSWITEHPEFYTKNAKGEITEPLNEDGTPIGWADVADLDYSNEGLHEAMINDMSYWITEEEVDGFRCDVAGSVPVVFWEKAIKKLREQKDVFMLAEAWEPELLKGEMFEMAYAWEGHHILNELAKGKMNVVDFDTYMKKMATDYEENDILMNFITNHDENSWNGTIEERMGDAAEALLALSYTLPGMPLIYSGQEYDMNHRLKFFEKDSIPKTKGKMWSLLTKLGAMKNNNAAFNGGKLAASYKRIETTKNKNVLAFRRDKEGKELIYIANLNSKSSEFKVPVTGKFINVITGDMLTLTPDQTHTFGPWEYLLLTNK